MVFGYGSNPTLADTDGDGLRDDEEALVRQTLPYVVDTDGDGLSDFGEVRIYGTNPRLADTDGDGRTDGEEILMTPATDPLDPDTDHDGLPDGWEVRHGLNPLSDVDGAGVDTDGDGLSNGRELALGTSPALRDTDGDGLEDADEVVHGTSPMLSDTDGDDRSDWDEIFGTPATDPLDPDTDHDGLPDGWEVRHGLDPLSAADGASADTDGDGIPNLAELCLGLDPRGVSTETGFEVYEDGMSANVGAWEVLPCAFSFDRPAALTNIVERTFRVDRASSWQQLFISSTLLEQDMATGQGGWNSSGIAIQYSLDGGAFEGAIPGAEWTAWRIPLGMRIVTNMTVRIVAQGRHPFLETGLYLLRWAPRLVVGESEDVRILDDGVQSPVVAVRRNAESAGYRMSVTLDFSGFPAFYGSGFWDEMPWDEFRAPPVPGVVVESDFDSWSTDVVLCAEDPLWVELPFGRTNSVVRLCCWEVVKNDAGAISSGPRSSPYRGAYPLSSEADRRAFHRAETTSPVAAAEYAAFPVDAPLEIVGRGGRSAAVRARRASSVPTSCGCPETCNGCIGLEIGGMYCSCVCLDHEDR
ncbi:MAG: hypothetical protein Q4G65_01035, partial [bacterium]|nr:hypothetical protein [bacterium]